MQHQNSANPTDIVDLCTSGLEVYISRERWQVQSLQRRNVKTNFAATIWPISFMKIQKNTGFFFLLLSSSIAPWVWAEWTNMCLNIVRQKIKKIMNLFCLPEWSILIGHSETTGLQYFNLAQSHVNNRFWVWCWSNSFLQQIYWFVNIPIKKRLMFEPVWIENW